MHALVCRCPARKSVHAKHSCARRLAVYSCGRGRLMLSNSMAALHLPAGNRLFNYHQFVPLAPLLLIANSADKLMERLIMGDFLLIRESEEFLSLISDSFLLHLFVINSNKIKYSHFRSSGRGELLFSCH